jgi:hypothetical protein
MGRLKRGTPLLSRDWLRAIDSTRALKRSKISAMTRRSWARVGVCFVVWPNGQVGLGDGVDGRAVGDEGYRTKSEREKQKKRRRLAKNGNAP